MSCFLSPGAALDQRIKNLLYFDEFEVFGTQNGPIWVRIDSFSLLL